MSKLNYAFELRSFAFDFFLSIALSKLSALIDSSLLSISCPYKQSFFIFAEFAHGSFVSDSSTKIRGASDVMVDFSAFDKSYF